MINCDNPEFEWIGIWWSPCLKCGKLAWDHEQSDPLQDIFNFKEMHKYNIHPSQFPPVMKE
jgi:hypothetical protein